MMLRPRDDHDQMVLESEIAITPKPTHISWTQDTFGNHVAIAHFEERAAELRFESTIRLDHAPARFRAGDIADFARTHPFEYAEEERPGLACFLTPLFPHPEIDRWAARFLGENGSADTYALLETMTRTIHRTLKHVARHEKGVQDPVRTLELGSGCCRDRATLMISALRSLGIAARFVSGYLHIAADDDVTDDEIIGGNTHAWVQAYVPGPGWVDFDPSSGVLGNQNLVRVAVVREPREAIPLQGAWIGSASDHLAMKVAVKVSAAAEIRDGPNAGKRVEMALP